MLLQRLTFQLVVGRIGSKYCSNIKYQHINLVSRKKSSNSTMDIAVTKSIVAITQMRSTNDKAANMCQVEQLFSKAKEQAATFLFLPECCDFVGENRQQTLELSEPLTGNTMKQYQALAKEHGMWLSLGGIHESILDKNAEKTNKIYNAHVLVNDCGEVVSVYRKLHLFDVDTPEYRFRESDIVTPGPRLVPPVETPVGALGLQICYDVRFAESSLLLRKAGAQILTYPSAFSYSTGRAHWELLLRARAVENQCYVLAPAQVGFHNAKRQSWGHAMAVNPWGKVLCDCGPDKELDVATVEIDLSTIATVKKSMPCFEHRRADVYSLTALDAVVPAKADVVINIPQHDRHFANNTINKDTIFYESPHCFAFTNLRCVVEGHILVSTKRMTPRLNGLTCEEMADLFTTVCKIQRMLEAFYKTTAATVTVQDGADAGQTVPHVHFHVMPRRPGDFGHNDQIYVDLDDRNDDKKNRELGERIDEAQKYRKFLKTQQN